MNAAERQVMPVLEEESTPAAAREETEPAPSSSTAGKHAWASLLARVRARPVVRVELPAVLWLAATIALGASVGAAVPRTGLDGSWITGITIARTQGHRFGSDLVFTFGPWGFLERPLLVNNQQFVLGALFAVAAATAMYAVGYACLRRSLSAAVAAPAAFAVTVAAPVGEPGLKFLCASLVAGILILEKRRATRTGGWRGAWPTASLAALAGLMLQVKFSEGTAILAVTGIVAISVPSLRSLAWNAGAAAGAFIAVLALGWLAAGQAPGDLGPWLRGSWQLSSGYQEAMAVEAQDRVVGYVLAVLLALVAGAAAVRTARRHRGIVALGVVLLVLATLEFGFKHGFTRHDGGHEVTFFLITGFLLLALAYRARRPIAVFLAAALALALVPATIDQFDPFAARDRWRASAEAVLNDEFRAQLLDEGQWQVQDRYRVPSAMVAETVGHPVSVDPFETTVAWAYSMSWNPVPVFQSYAAYSRPLDELNARAIVAAPADQIVLRQALEMIDERNTRWETPRYLLALACNYTAGAAEGQWSLLHHGENRCAEPRNVLHREIGADEVVETPAVGPNEILVARFTPQSDGVLSTMGQTVLKDWSPFTITADGRRFRLPEALADGPLMMSFPAGLGWAAPFDGFHYQRLSFSKAGTLEFQVVAVS
jgi:hypothetical protein